MKYSRASHGSELTESGTPFFHFEFSDGRTVSRSRIMPSQFSFPMLPMACTFIRNLNLRDR